MIDIDHLLDYYLHYRTFSGGFKHFYDSCIEPKLDKLRLVLHSYELLLIFWILVFAFPKNLLLIAISLGLTQHMLFDQITNKMPNLFYFFIFRLSRDFKKESLISDEIKK